MKKFLLGLRYATLIKIARDLGFTGVLQSDAIAFVLEQAKGYRWNVEDLKSRYSL